MNPVPAAVRNEDTVPESFRVIQNYSGQISPDNHPSTRARLPLITGTGSRPTPHRNRCYVSA